MESTDYNHIRQWLEPLLARHNFSAEDLSKKIGVTRTMIYYWMADKHRPSEETMKKVCDVFGRPFEEGLRQYTPKKAGRRKGFSPGRQGLR